MRDAFFERGNDFLAHRRRLRKGALDQWNELPDRQTLVSDLARWCGDAFEVIASTAPRDQPGLLQILGCHGVDPFAASRGAPSLNRLKAGFTALIGDAEHDARDLASWVLGHALAVLLVEELAAGNDPRHLLAIDFASGSSRLDLAYEAFNEALRSRLPDVPAAREALLRVLGEHVAAISREPAIGVPPSEKDEFGTYVREWQAHAVLDALWGDHGPWFPTHYDELDLAVPLLATDRRAVLERLDAIRFRQPLDDLLARFDIRHDREQIGACLGDAPPTSDDGTSWNGSLLAPLLLRTADRHAEELWRTAAGIGDPGDVARSRDTLTAWFHELARIVVQRADGPFLATQWLLLKLADERRDRHRPAPPRDARGAPDLRHVDLLEWIVPALSAAGLSGTDVADCVEFPVPDPAVQPSPSSSPSAPDETANPCLRALCAIELLEDAQHGPDGYDRSPLLATLDAMLGARHPAFELELHLAASARDLPTARCGLMFARSGDPPRRWRSSWDALAEQRRRAQHWRQTRDADALAPTLFLLGAGIAAIDWMLSIPQRSPDDAQDLWRHLFDAARECWLTIDVAHLTTHLETQIGRLFARHSLVFSDPPIAMAGDTRQPSAASRYPATLAQHLALLGGDDAMLAVCYLNARDNGVGPHAMAAVRQYDSGLVESLLRQFDRWQSLERPERRLATVLDQIRSELHIPSDPEAHRDRDV